MRVRGASANYAWGLPMPAAAVLHCNLQQHALQCGAPMLSHPRLTPPNPFMRFEHVLSLTKVGLLVAGAKLYEN